MIKGFVIICVVLLASIGFSQDSSYMAQYQAYMAAQNVSVVSVPEGTHPWSISNEFSSEWITESDSTFDQTLEITAQTDTSSWPFGGLYFTSNKNEASGVYASISVEAKNGVAFKSSVNEGQDHLLNSSSNINLPVFVRLEKIGSSVKGYYRQTVNDTWVEIGNVTIAENLSPGVAKMKFQPKF